MEWISVKDKYPDPVKDEGWYVVLIGRKPHAVYFSFRSWKNDWHIPDEWQQPTHYIKLPDETNIFSGLENKITMD